MIEMKINNNKKSKNERLNDNGDNNLYLALNIDIKIIIKIYEY